MQLVKRKFRLGLGIIFASLGVVYCLGTLIEGFCTNDWLHWSDAVIGLEMCIAGLAMCIDWQHYNFQKRKRL
jgi:hypothetical protein